MQARNSNQEQSQVIKNNPDLKVSEYQQQLVVLDDFAAYIKANGDNLGNEVSQNALKVLHCLRFIKINKAFILYAVSHPTDPFIYEGGKAGDMDARLLRDFNHLAFHFADASSDQADVYWDKISLLIKDVEDAYQEMKGANQLKPFVRAFQWDHDIGCLEARVIGALKFASQVASYKITTLNEKLNTACAALGFERFIEETIPLQHRYQWLFEYFDREDYFGKPILVGSNGSPDTLILTRPLLAHHLRKYVVGTLGEKDPPPVDPTIALSNCKEKWSATDALHVIQDQNGLIKAIASPDGDNQHWDFLFKQLASPNKVRPILPLSEEIDRGQIFNPWHQQNVFRRLIGVRGSEKPTPYIKKTATTLLPADGKMALFGQGIGTVGLLWDLRYCDLKEEKYTFAQNAGTRILKRKLWQGAPNSIGIAAIRECNDRARESNRVLENNEVLTSPSRQGLRAIVVTGDSFESRINALRIQHYIQATYDIDLPLLIQSEHRPVKEYSFQKQLKDIESLQKQKKITDTQQWEYSLIKRFYAHAAKACIEHQDNDENYFKLVGGYLDFILAQPLFTQRQLWLDETEWFKQVDWRKRDTHGKSLLHYAALAGSVNVATYLMKTHQLKLDDVDQDGNTPMHDACRSNAQVARLFVTFGAQLNFPKNHAGETPRACIQYFYDQEKKCDHIVDDRKFFKRMLISMGIMLIPLIATFILGNPILFYLGIAAYVSVVLPTNLIPLYVIENKFAMKTLPIYQTYHDIKHWFAKKLSQHFSSKPTTTANQSADLNPDKGKVLKVNHILIEPEKLHEPALLNQSIDNKGAVTANKISANSPFTTFNKLTKSKTITFPAHKNDEAKETHDLRIRSMLGTR